MELEGGEERVVGWTVSPLKLFRLLFSEHVLLSSQFLPRASLSLFSILFPPLGLWFTFLPLQPGPLD